MIKAEPKRPGLDYYLCIRNSADVAKRMWLETTHAKDQMNYIFMDSETDAASMFRKFNRQRRMNLISC